MKTPSLHSPLPLHSAPLSCCNYFYFCILFIACYMGRFFLFVFFIDSLFSPKAGTSLKSYSFFFFFKTCYFLLICFCWLLEHWWTALTTPRFPALSWCHIYRPHSLQAWPSTSIASQHYIPPTPGSGRRRTPTKLCSEYLQGTVKLLQREKHPTDINSISSKK